MDFLCLLVHFLVAMKSVSAYYSRAYGGYVFTIPTSLRDYATSQIDAQTKCIRNGTQLLEIGNYEIQTYTDQLFAQLPDNQRIYDGSVRIYTNGIRQFGEWTWLNGNSKAANTITITDQGQVQAYYAIIKSNGTEFQIASEPSVNDNYYICQVSGNCSGNGFQYDGRCYTSYNEYAPWYDARNRCINRGGDLASFEFISTNEGFNVLKGLSLTTWNDYWIGLRRERWTWQGSGSDVMYSRWSDGQPQDSTSGNVLCLSSRNDRPWVACQDQNYPFICLSGPFTTTSVTSSSSSQTWRTTPATVETKHDSTRRNYTPFSSTSISPAKDSSINNDTNNTGIGVGVGIGGGLVVIGVIVGIFFLIRKRGCPRRKPEQKLIQPPDIIALQSSDTPYAIVPRSPEGIENTAASDKYAADSSQIQYAQLDHVTTQSSQLKPSRTTTLSPPSATTPSHVAINGDEYAEVMRTQGERNAS